METQFPVVTVCGSMRYFKKMLDLASKLTTDGFIVLMPFKSIPTDEQEGNSIKEMLDEMHLTKISMSEAIFVIGEHRGKSTTREIEYAREHGVKVIEIA